MGNWFDDAARRSAQRSSRDDAGLTRRSLIVRGAFVAGAAWTAPVLMATRASAFGVSTCNSPSFVCGASNTLQVCCVAGDTCNVDPATGAGTCIPPDAPGGVCSNNGVGICTSSTGVKSECNGHASPPQCNACSGPHICGGEAAPCNIGTGVICAPHLTCTTGTAAGTGFCRKPCSANGDCNTGQICDTHGYCAQTCSVKADCNGTQNCVTDGANKVCTYV